MRIAEMARALADAAESHWLVTGVGVGAAMAATLGIIRGNDTTVVLAILTLAVCAAVAMRRAPMRIAHRGSMRFGYWRVECRTCGAVGLDTHIAGPLRIAVVGIAQHVREDH